VNSLPGGLSCEGVEPCLLPCIKDTMIAKCAPPPYFDYMLSIESVVIKSAFE
jgi:hypothetical protein